MDFEFSKPAHIQVQKPLKQRLQEASAESKTKKEVQWTWLSRTLQTLAKNSIFVTTLHIHSLGPLTTDDLCAMGFQVKRRNLVDVVVSWSLDEKDEPPMPGPARCLFDLTLTSITNMLVRHAHSTGSRLMHMSKHSHMDDKNRVEWKRVLRLEGLDVEHIDRTVVVRW